MLEGTGVERACSVLETKRRPKRLELVSKGESGTSGGHVKEFRIYSKIPKYESLELILRALNILNRVLK